MVKIGFVDDGKTQGLDNTGLAIGAAATVKYVNDYLGGLNGHKIELDTCTTNQTPSGGTECGVQLSKDHVAAVVAGVTGQDASVFQALSGTGIAFVINNTATPAVMAGTTGFVLNNPLGLGTAQITVAKEAGVKKGAVVVIDVPGATGPVEALSKPLYAGAGIGLDLIPISPEVADPTAQIQQAISAGAGQFTVLGTPEFVASVIKSAKQLGFKGPIVTQVTSFPKDLVSAIPGGLAGVTSIGNVSYAATGRTVYSAVMAKYGVGSPDDETATGFQTMLAFVEAVNETPNASDAASVLAALQHMPTQLSLPIGGGMVFQCGAKKVAVLQGVCISQVLVSKLNADGSVAEASIVG